MTLSHTQASVATLASAQLSYQIVPTIALGANVGRLFFDGQQLDFFGLILGGVSLQDKIRTIFKSQTLRVYRRFLKQKKC